MTASTAAAGATLQQGDADDPLPLAFFSRKFTATERRYSTFGRELLAACLSVKPFRHYAEAGRIVVYIDHKPLIHALQSHSDKYSEREFRQLDLLAQFDLEFRHVRGRDNEVADALSRITINAVLLEDGIDYEQTAAEQRSEGISISSAALISKHNPFPVIPVIWSAIRKPVTLAQ